MMIFKGFEERQLDDDKDGRDKGKGDFDAKSDDNGTGDSDGKGDKY